MRSGAKVGCLLCTLVAAPVACQSSLVTGSTTGGRTPLICPASSTRQPDGTCECFQNDTECPGSDGGLICAQVLLDDDNCGGCGIVCPNGESCLGGACTCHLTTCEIGDGGSVCIDPESDALNCNDCGRTCSPDEHCSLGQCFSCDPPTAYCGPDSGLECVNLTDDNNCGGCGIRCAADQHCAAPGGAGGVCVCDPDGGPDSPLLPIENCDGTCVDIDSDFNHCGNCTACVPPATECVNGNCQ